MILPLEQQVAPLALCRRLKELGAPQETHFRWTRSEAGPRDVVLDTYTAVKFSVRTHCAAYTVAELGAMLPGGFTIDRDPYSEARFGHVVWTARFDRNGQALIEDGQTEAEARAALLIALAECGVATWPAPKA